MTTVAIDPRVRARRAEVLRREGRRRLRWVAGALAAVLVVVALVLATRSPILDVDEVRVDGVVYTSVDAVRTAAGIEEGTALTDLDLAAARQAVAYLPWVDTVRSHRSWWGTVTFEIVERSPVAVTEVVDGWAVIDHTGRVLEIVASRPPGLVQLAVPVTDPAPGEWLPPAVEPAAAAAAALPAGLAERVDRLTPDGGVRLALAAGGTIELGGVDELEAKYLAALTVLARVDTTCLATLDVQVPAAPVLTREASCP